MNARRAWRKHVTSLLDSALDRNDAVLEQVSAAMATAIEHADLHDHRRGPYPRRLGRRGGKARRRRTRA